MVDKANVIELLDPATGIASASYTHSSWLSDVVVVEKSKRKWIACADQVGTVLFLGASDLKPVSSLVVSDHLTRPIVFAPAMPRTWASHDEFSDASPTLVVGDRAGWIYLVELPE